MPLVGLIAVDIDGTLLDSQQRVSKRTAVSLRTAEASGIEVVLSTGQSYARADSVRNMLGLGSHLISSNGALIRTADGLTIAREALDLVLANKILRAAGQFASRGALTFERSVSVEFEGRDVLDTIGVARLLGSTTFDPLMQISLCGPRAQMELVVRAIAQMPMAHRVVAAMQHLGYDCVVDVGPAGATKGIALARLCAYLKVPPERVAAIGDNLNDCGMLEFAGYSFVVANAPKEMKARGWRIVPANDDDGVAHAIEAVLRCS